MVYIKKTNILLISVLLFFTVLYALISLVNHYNFRTYALDLGLFNQALYQYSQGKAALFTLDIAGREMNILGDHFSPVIILFVPFYYLFDSYTLLIIQVLTIVSGGYGICKIVKFSTNQKWLPEILSIHFFSIWGIYSALSFDFHTNVIAAMLVPWFIFFLLKDKKINALILFLFILLSKENMALWMIFILLAWLIKKKYHLKQQKYFFELFLIGFSIIYFIVVMFWLLPYFNNYQGNGFEGRYSYLGNSYKDILINIISHPIDSLQLLWKNTTGDPVYNGIKTETHLMVLISGGFAFFISPWYFIMLIPVYAQKFLSADYGFWGINAQYSIEFVPVLTLAVLDTVLKIKNLKTRLMIAGIITLITFSATFHTLENRKSKWHIKENIVFYSPKHYDAELNVSEIKKALRLIPENVSVSVSPEIAPHLAHRLKLYHFPVVKDAQYVVLFTKNRSFYPLSEIEFTNKYSEMIKSGDYIVFFNEYNLLVLKRK